jgi:DNA (cytosine-5)-methyltransferase 1
VVNFDANLYAGSGGWDEGNRLLGRPPSVGIELDSSACATRAAAGYRTIRGDVAAFPVDRLAGRVSGLKGSAPCPTFSAAGQRSAAAVMAILEDAICDAFQGWTTRAAQRRDMARTLRMAWWPSAKLTRRERSARIWAAVRSASLMIEPARFIHACSPEWVALEQVPAVLPLWKAYARELEAMGFWAWCGVLDAADYGVPQVRLRAILIASRTRKVGRPPATHYDPRKGSQLFGEPWVTMCDAIGWGMTRRPYFTLATAGGSRGGADEQVGGSHARRALYAERDAGYWVPDPRRLEKARGTRQVDMDSIRLTVDEAAVLQSFPRGYPWQGTRTIQYQQIGNVVPPLLAMHVLAEATGTAIPMVRGSGLAS